MTRLEKVVIIAGALLALATCGSLILDVRDVSSSNPMVSTTHSVFTRREMYKLSNGSYVESSTVTQVTLAPPLSGN